MRNCTILCLLSIFLTSAAWADVIATYKYKDGSIMTLVTKDEDHVRMDTSPTAYTLLSNNKVYSVSQDDDGKWNVMDMEQASAAAGQMGSLFGGGSQALPDIEISYKKTGKSEMVAGYTGTVYMMETRENGKVTEKEEVVLCTHSDLKKVTKGWTAIGTRMSQIMGGSMADSFQDAVGEAENSGYGGMLRYGQEIWLDNLKKRTLSAAYYEIPEGAETMKIGEVTDTSGQSQSQAGQVLKQDSEDVGEAAHQEAKDATIDEVKEGVRSVFKSLFD